MEGGGRVVDVEFPSRDAATAFYYSSEYQAIPPHRMKNPTGNGTIMAGAGRWSAKRTRAIG